jgi:outer membrane protein assembly factor BamB
VRAQRVGDVVLITDGPDTTAVDARTGAGRWHADIAVRPLTGDKIGLVQDPQFRPYTEYNQNGGAPGEIFFSASGVPHDEAPIATVLRGINLDTGATAWSVRVAGSVEVFTTGQLLVLEAGRLTLRSATTGAVLRTTDLPPLSGQDPDSGQLVGDEMLVSYGAGDSKSRSLVAYSVRTFRSLWLVPEAPTQASPAVCVELICADQAAGTSVLDPATGRTLWRTPGLELVRIGGDVLELDPSSGEPVKVVDPVNGNQRLSLSGWKFDVAVSADGPLLLRRTDASRSSEFVVVDDDPAQLRPLGASRGVVSDCAADDQFVVCRGTGVLQVFAYRD